MSIPSISRTAWDAANSSEAITGIGFDEFQMLTAIYKMQSVLDEYHNQLIVNVYNNQTYSPDHLVPTFNNIKRLNEDYLDIARNVSSAYKVNIEKYTGKKLESLSRPYEANENNHYPHRGLVIFASSPFGHSSLIHSMAFLFIRIC